MTRTLKIDEGAKKYVIRMSAVSVPVHTGHYVFV